MMTEIKSIIPAPPIPEATRPTITSHRELATLLDDGVN